MSQIKLAFVANDGNAYAPETEIGKQLGFITWTPSKLRIERAEGSFLDDEVKVTLGQRVITIQEFLKENQIKKEGKTPEQIANEEKEILSHKTYIEKVIADLPGDIQAKYKNKIDAPKVLFYTDENGKPSKESSETINVTIPAHKNFLDIYVGGLFQKEALYGGASAEAKDIKITANGEEAFIYTMIRVRRNANELTKKAKADFVKALSCINMLSSSVKESMGKGLYSTDFYMMHTKGSKDYPHGNALFLPWHRMYLLDLERSMQIFVNEVSLHYWKFDEPAANIFSEDFLGKTIFQDRPKGKHVMTQGFADCFAEFDKNNPLYNWAVLDEKLIRRKAFFDTKKDYGYTIFEKEKDYPQIIKDSEALSKGSKLGRPKDVDAFTNIESVPHGSAHTSFNGFINFVPTAAKDPLFYLLHCNVDRIWAYWQHENNLFSPYDEKAYPEQDVDNTLDWQHIDAEMWPWNMTYAKTGQILFTPGSRGANFTTNPGSNKVINDNVPKVCDAINYKGIDNINDNLGFDYDSNVIVNKSPKVVANKNTYKDLLFSRVTDILKNISEINELSDVFDELFPNKESLISKINSLQASDIFDPGVKKESAKILAFNNTIKNFLLQNDGTINDEQQISAVVSNVQQDDNDTIAEVKKEYDLIIENISYRGDILPRHITIYLMLLKQQGKYCDFINVDFNNEQLDVEDLDTILSILSFTPKGEIGKIFNGRIEELFNNLDDNLDKQKPEILNKINALKSLLNKD